MERIRAVFNWSGGKDSAHALWRAMRSGDYEIVALLTTVDGSTRRSTMHGIPAALLQAQAERIGIPLYRLDLAPNGDMADYGAAMSRAVAHFGARGVTHFIFGDIFLHDVRAYRERQLAPFGIEVVEPLWGESSQEVMADFLASGLKTVVVTTMDDGLGRAAVGRVVDRDFVASLPAGTDPNGENGEYHTFCYDGPIFASPVPFRLGTPFSRSYDVRLDDGTVCGFSSASYLDTHRARTLSADTIGAEAGQAAVPGALQVVDTRTAFLRLYGARETLCYEYLCETDDGQRCVIAVNARTGQQERIQTSDVSGGVQMQF